MTDRILPSYSQLLDVADPVMRHQACGAAALAMVLGASGLERAPSVDEVLKKGLASDAYRQERGWLHRELAAVARSYGVNAHPEDWSGDDLICAWEHLQDAVARGPVVASVDPSFSPSASSHLIVVCGLEDGSATIYDPFRAGRNEVRYEVPLEFLRDHWTRRIICIHPLRK